MTRAFRPNPALTAMSNEFPGTVLDVRLDIGASPSGKNKKNNGGGHSARMAIQNLVLGLQKMSTSQDGTGQIPMPGANGPHPGTSGGVGSLQIVQPGHFIDLTGTVKTQFSDVANWELVWRNESPAGSLLCGLDLQENAVRNGAVLPRGRIYLSFPVWNADALQKYQERKAHVQSKAAGYLRDRDAELHKMRQASNVFAKAMHYRNAAAAVEQYSLQPVRKMEQVPGLTDEEVVEIADDLLLTRAGTVWSKDDSVFGGGKQSLLGVAVIRSSKQEDENKNQVPAETLRPISTAL